MAKAQRTRELAKKTQETLRNYPGTQDFLFGDVIARDFVREFLREIFEEFGFDEQETPAIELASTLIEKYGQEADKAMFLFSKYTDAIGLRYDLTVPLARVVGMKFMQEEISIPYKRYQIAPVWRADKPAVEQGRFREFGQCDVDTVGSSSMLADAEIISVIYTALKRLKLEEFTIRLNNRKVLDAMAASVGVTERSQALNIYRAIDKLDKVGEQAVFKELLEREVSSVPLVKVPFLTQDQAEKIMRLIGIAGDNRQKLQGMREALEGQEVKGIEELRELLNYLKGLGIEEKYIWIDFTLARGLDYYTGPIYETAVEKPKIGSITGGGRYDTLIKQLGGPDLPATGTSFGLERLVAVMRELGVLPKKTTAVEALVAVFSSESVTQSLEIVSKLRGEGIKAEVYLDLQAKLARQLRYAAHKGVPVAVIPGPEELAKGLVVVKDLAQEKQEVVPLSELSTTVRRILGS